VAGLRHRAEAGLPGRPLEMPERADPVAGACPSPPLLSAGLSAQPYNECPLREYKTLAQIRGTLTDGEGSVQLTSLLI
jgi:hypothetical protein